VDQLKIDRSFVTNLTRDDGSAAIVRSTIDLGRNSQLEVVAEGVENRATWARKRGARLRYRAGLLHRRPLTRDGVGDWLAARSPRDWSR
jgi:EAL domain-containing protein (putative c-di-GMP-specific phosphodiesterase class I)